MPTGHLNSEIAVLTKFSCYIWQIGSVIVLCCRWGLTAFLFDPVQELEGVGCLLHDDSY